MSPDTSQMPYISQQGPAPQSPTPAPIPPRKRHLLIGAIVAAVLIVGVVVWMLLMNGGGSNNGGDDPATLYTERSEYSDLNNTGIGDPMGLVSVPSKTIAHYKGQVVVQPCALLSLDELRAAGLRTRANQLVGSVSRSYFDGSSQTSLPLDNDLFLPRDEESNVCNYSLEEDKGQVEITTFQSSYTNNDALDLEINRRYSLTDKTAGLETYVRKQNEFNANSSTYIVNGDSKAYIQLVVSTANKEAKKRVLQTVATNLQKALKTPTPVPNFVYDSPIFTGKPKQPCSLLTNADFKKIVGVDAGPLVFDMFSTAVGVQNDGIGSDRRYNFTEAECKRHSVRKDRDHAVRLEVKTYEASNIAQAFYAFTSEASPFTEKVSEIDQQVGDEAFYGNVAGMDNAIIFRQGSYVAKITYTLPTGNDAIPSEERIQKLIPVAQSVAQRLR